LVASTIIFLSTVADTDARQRALLDRLFDDIRIELTKQQTDVGCRPSAKSREVVVHGLAPSAPTCLVHTPRGDPKSDSGAFVALAPLAGRFTEGTHQ